MKTTLFIFLRHAESEKNIIDITGGNGKKLTALGAEQASAVADELLHLLEAQECEILSSPAVQAVETATIIAQKLGSNVTISEELLPANMGVISGLPSQTIKDDYPDLWNVMHRWRAAEIEACDMKIPGMEPPIAFWDRMCCFLHKHNVGGVKIIVTTRSLMVFAKNFASKKNPQKGGGYRHTDVKYCEMVSFTLDYHGSLVWNMDSFGSDSINNG